MDLKGIIFDMDGVLCSTVEYHYQSWKAMAEQEGIPFSREDNEKLRGLTRRRSLEVILGEREASEAEMQRMMDVKNQRYLELMDTITPDDLLPGVARLLNELEAADVRMAVASGSSHAQGVLERLEIDGFIEAVCDGREIEASKPAPDAFLCAAERLEVEPAACLAFEDASAGVAAAREAGMCVIGVGDPERVGEADACIRDLSEVDLADLRAIHRRWLQNRR